MFNSYKSRCSRSGDPTNIRYPGKKYLGVGFDRDKISSHDLTSFVIDSEQSVVVSLNLKSGLQSSPILVLDGGAKVQNSGGKLHGFRDLDFQPRLGEEIPGVLGERRKSR